MDTVTRFFRQQRHDVAGIDPPIVANHVRDFAFEQETVREKLMARNARELDILDRVAKWPVTQVVEQGRDQQQFSVSSLDDTGKAFVACQSPQVAKR